MKPGEPRATSAMLVSGGIDSCVMMSEAVRASNTLFPIYVRTGLVWEDAELHWLRKFIRAVRHEACEELVVLDLPVRDLYGDHWSTTGRDFPGFTAGLESNYLPGRNLLLLAKTAVFCAVRGIEQIALAPLVDNPFPDGTPDFFRDFGRLATIATGVGLRIELPFRTLHKAEVIRRGADLPLGLTFSCIHPIGFEHCGECTKCAERQRGFHEAGISDPTCYCNRDRSETF